jgi:hypothetical protein
MIVEATVLQHPFERPAWQGEFWSPVATFSVDCDMKYLGNEWQRLLSAVLVAES